MREEVLGALRDLQQARGLTAIVVSSDLAVLTRIASKIVVMQNGIIVGLGDIESLTLAPENDYLKGLARSRAALDGGAIARSRPPGWDRLP